ncbi:MAG: dihydrodipicolinate synthase family protein [Bacteroidales bacterium]|nr:dihydrodipicolinate synthase family protein [Bacteroidales bacterium]
MKNQFRGIIPPMITPLVDNNSLDIKGLESIIEHIISGGVHGLFILGTTGEGTNLSYELRYDLIQRVCIQVSKRIPVLVGITDTSLTESIKMAEKAAKYGAEAVVSSPPFYFKLSQSELISYFNDLANRLPLPLFLYNMPEHTKVYFESDTVREIAKNDRVIGLKDSSGNSVYFQTLVHAMKDNLDFSLFVGPDIITAETVLMGGHGGVNGGANMFPKLYVDLYEAAITRDFNRLVPIQEKIRQLWYSIYYVSNSSSCHLTGIKCALSLMGICNDFVASPFRKLNEKNKATVKRYLEALDYKSLM